VKTDLEVARESEAGGTVAVEGSDGGERESDAGRERDGRPARAPAARFYERRRKFAPAET